MRLAIIPLIWREREPANPEIHAAAKQFAREHLSAELEPETFYKVWLACTNEDEMLRPWGLAGLTGAVDMSVFHIRPPNGSRDEVELFALASRGLMERARAYLQDQGMAGKGVFVHVSPESEHATMLNHLFKRLKTRSADRVIVDV